MFALNVMIPEHFLKLLCKMLNYDLQNALNFLRIMSINKLKLKKTVDLLNETLNEHCRHYRFGF